MSLWHRCDAFVTTEPACAAFALREQRAVQGAAQAAGDAATQQQAAKLGHETAKKLGCAKRTDAETIACLRAADVADLFRADAMRLWHYACAAFALKLNQALQWQRAHCRASCF